MNPVERTIRRVDSFQGGDRRVYAAMVERARMRPEVEADVWFSGDADAPNQEESKV